MSGHVAAASVALHSVGTPWPIVIAVHNSFRPVYPIAINQDFARAI